MAGEPFAKRLAKTTAVINWNHGLWFVVLGLAIGIAIGRMSEYAQDQAAFSGFIDGVESDHTEICSQIADATRDERLSIQDVDQALRGAVTRLEASGHIVGQPLEFYAFNLCRLKSPYTSSEYRYYPSSLDQLKR